MKVFGIADEGKFGQTNYLMGEEDCIGIDGGNTHGPDAVISMLHSHMAQTPDAKEFSLHADNCSGSVMLISYRPLAILKKHYLCI